MIVAVSGLSGDTNAYRSVLSAVGSCEISGASRWLDAEPAAGPLPRNAASRTAAAPAARRMSATLRIALLLFRRPFGLWWGRRLRHSHDQAARFDEPHRPRG